MSAFRDFREQKIIEEFVEAVVAEKVTTEALQNYVLQCENCNEAKLYNELLGGMANMATGALGGMWNAASNMAGNMWNAAGRGINTMANNYAQGENKAKLTQALTSSQALQKNLNDMGLGANPEITNFFKRLTFTLQNALQRASQSNTARFGQPGIFLGPNGQAG